MIVGLNGPDHLRELRELVTVALSGLDQPGMPPTYERLSLDRGERMLRSAFRSVVRHDFASLLRRPGPGPVAAYVRSLSEAARQPGPGPLVAAVTSRLPAAPGAAFQVTAHSGGLICA